MKQLKLTFIILCFFSLKSFSQLVLEKTINNYFYPTPVHFSISGYKYYFFQTIKDTVGPSLYYSNIDSICIYDISSNLQKTISVPAITYKGIKYHPEAIYYISDQLFNLDSTIEYLAEYGLNVLDSSCSNSAYLRDSIIVLLIDEHGNNLQNVTSSSICNGPGYIGPRCTYFSDGQNFSKLFITGEMGVQVFNLPGFLPCENCSSLSGINTLANSNDGGEIIAFPDPTGKNLMFNYKLPEGINKGIIEIDDGSGRAIRKIEIFGSSGSKEISVAGLSSSTYYYYLLGETFRSVAKKIMIVQ